MQGPTEAKVRVRVTWLKSKRVAKGISSILLLAELSIDPSKFVIDFRILRPN